MSGTTPEPIAQGELAKTPFAHLLLHVHHKQMSGTLVLWPTAEGVKGQDRIRFEAGWPVAARLIDKAAALDRGMLPLFARREGPYAFYETDLVGDATLQGRVDPLMVLTASLRGSVRDDAVEAYIEALGLEAQVRFRVGCDVKRYVFQPKEASFLDVIRAAPATVGELITQCELGPVMGRRLVYLLLITRAIERVEGAVPTAVTPSAAVPSAAVPSAVVSSAAVPSAAVPSAAVPSAVVPSAVTSSTVAQNTLAPTAPASVPFDLPLPDLGDPPSQAGGSPRVSRPSMPMQSDRAGAARFTTAMPVPPAAPSGLSAEGAAFWAEVVARCAAIDQQNYYEMLGVARDVGGEAVRKSYFALAKRWHPDRSTGELAPLRGYVEPIFALFTAAHETLADEAKRGAYLRTVQDGGGTPEADRKLEAILWAAKEHQKAEVLMRRRDFEGAAALLKAAIEIVADESDLLAALAWCLFQLPVTEARQAEMTSAVDRALALEPKHDRAHYYRGMILQRGGHDADALTSFRRALELNKKNADAAREVRLAEMRRGKGGAGPSKAPPAPEGDAKSADKKSADKKSEGGLFSKLFGGKKG